MICIGDPHHFATIRSFLESAYADDANVLADRVGDFNPQRHQGEPPLVRMLFLGRAISASEWEATAPAGVREAFSSLGLTEPASDGRVRSSCLLYRMRDIYVTSDRFMNDEGEVGKPAADSVYYALTETAQNYLWSLPGTPHERALDLGSGSGAAALVLARTCREVYATDISPRCAVYSEFNRLLNAVENVIVREGSFYEPVQGLKFDLVTCHPPFDFSLSSKSYVYADGGSDGEFVTRGVIAGLPDMLAPGGKYIAAFRATDREDAPIEVRIRKWLGEQREEFDIAVAIRSTVKPEEHAISASMLSKQNLDEYQFYMDFFKELRVSQFIYCHLLIQRSAGTTPLTIRRRTGMRCTSAELEGLLAWERSRNSIDLAHLRLSPSTHMSLNVRHVLQKGELMPVEYKFDVTHPFAEEEPVPEWVAKLVAFCVGDRTGDEVYELMRKEYPIGRPDFEAAVKRLISLGVLQPASGSKTMSSN